MKREKKPIIVICIVAAGIALAAVYTHFSLRTNTVRTVFYGLNETEISALSSWLDGRGVSWEAFVFDSSKPLSALIKNSSQYDLLFVYDGANMDSMKTIVRNAESAALQMLPLPIRIAVQTDGRLIGVPVLVDPFQLLCSKERLAKKQISAPLSLAALEDMAVQQMAGAEQLKAGFVPAPFMCAGGCDDHLIMMFSSLLESIGGMEAWASAVSLLGRQEEGDFAEFFSLNAVRETVCRLAVWQKKGFLSAKWLALTLEEQEEAAEKNLPLIVFAPQSFYCGLNEKTAARYALWYMPAGKIAGKRFLIARTIVALQFSVPKSPLQSAAQARKKLDSVRALIRETVCAFAQTKLAQAAMLVPVNSNAQSSFSASSSLAYLCAAHGVLSDTAQAALTTSEQRVLFAQALRKHIRAAVPEVY